MAPLPCIYLVRHGTSEWNLLKKWQGQTDTKLAPIGITQARARGKAFREEGILFHAAYCSDLRRASHTAELLMEECSIKTTTADMTTRTMTTKTPLLRECSLGEFEGMKKSDIYGEQYEELWALLNSLPHEARIRTPYFPGLETPHEVGTRCAACMVDAALRAAASDPDGATGKGEANPGRKNVLVVTHSTVIESLLATLFGADFDSIAMENLCWLRFRLVPASSSTSKGTPSAWRLELEAQKGLDYRHSPDAILADTETTRHLYTGAGIVTALTR